MSEVARKLSSRSRLGLLALTAIADDPVPDTLAGDTATGCEFVNNAIDLDQ